MTFNPVQVDGGIEIRDGNGNIIETFNTWPPREAEQLDSLFEEANISTPQKDLWKLMFGVTELQDERTIE